MTRFMGLWPVLDDRQTLDELTAQADRQIVALALAQGAVVCAAPTWSVVEGEVEGYPSPTGLYLICEAEARRPRGVPCHP